MSTEAPTAVLLSLRPKYAELILSREKRAEIRRLPSRIPLGSIALLYASTPDRSLLGAARVDRVERLAPSTTWRRWGPDTGLVKSEFHSYVDGLTQVTTIVLGAVVRFSTPVPLDALRQRWTAFVAPQSYRFVGDIEFGAILNGERAELEKLDEG